MQDVDLGAPPAAGAGPEKEPELPQIVFQAESRASLVKRKAEAVFTNITLEPVMLLWGVIRSIDGIARRQLILGKNLCLPNRLSLAYDQPNLT